jgi:hypothetical protein
MTGGSGLFLEDLCDNGILTLVVRVCNRGTNPIASGVSVGFFDGDPDLGGTLVCSTVTSEDLDPGECLEVSCDWQNAPVDDPRDVTVMVDFDSDRTECLETNNRAMILDATCSFS